MKYRIAVQSELNKIAIAGNIVLFLFFTDYRMKGSNEHLSLSYRAPNSRDFQPVEV